MYLQIDLVWDLQLKAVERRKVRRPEVLQAEAVSALELEKEEEIWLC